MFYTCHKWILICVFQWIINESLYILFCTLIFFINTTFWDLYVLKHMCTYIYVYMRHVCNCICMWVMVTHCHCCIWLTILWLTHTPVYPRLSSWTSLCCPPSQRHLQLPWCSCTHGAELEGTLHREGVQPFPSPAGPRLAGPSSLSKATTHSHHFVVILLLGLIGLQL